jgi:hypothetical protein
MTLPMNIRTLDDGLDQAVQTMRECGYSNVQCFRRDQDGHPGIVIDGYRNYTTDEEILLNAELTDDWLMIVMILESEASA